MQTDYYMQTGFSADIQYMQQIKNGYDNEILKIRGLGAPRSPGRTCMFSLETSKNYHYGTINEPINNSKGCGGVMRVAPAGLYYYDSPEIAFRMAADFAAITHGHPCGYLSAGAFGFIVAQIIGGMNIRSAVIASLKDLNKYQGHEECTALLKKALKLSKSNVKPYKAVISLGEGWVAEETLAIAVYCALKYPHDFKKANCLAVNHGGDSDSTGAVCGNILGAYLGRKGVPQQWIEQVESSDFISMIAQKLYFSVQKQYQKPMGLTAENAGIGEKTV